MTTQAGLLNYQAKTLNLTMTTDEIHRAWTLTSNKNPNVIAKVHQEDAWTPTDRWTYVRVIKDGRTVHKAETLFADAAFDIAAKSIHNHE